MAVDVKDLRPGDTVLIAFKIARVEGGDWPYVVIDEFDLDGGIATDHYLSAGMGAITQHIPRKIEVGDRVRVKGVSNGLEYEVIAGPRTTSAGSEQVALWGDRLGFSWSHLTDLERVS